MRLWDERGLPESAAADEFHSERNSLTAGKNNFYAKNMLWINFLHLYQPGNAEDFVIEESTEKSYLRIIRALEHNPHLKFTLNISGCLILRWEHMGMSDILRRIKKLVDNGQVELVGTASFHPLLPLIRYDEAKKQILENENILKRFFGESFKPKGFFLPEMAYSAPVGKLIKKIGYEYIILDEISAGGKLDRTDTSKIYKDKESGLKIVFRSRKISLSYVPETILKMSAENIERTVVTGTDAELYGLRHNDPDALLEKASADESIMTLTISGFIKDKVAEKTSLVDSTWESSEKELREKNPYALWRDKKNILQNKLWSLAGLAQEASRKFKRDENSCWVDWHLVRGLASCTFWWASGRDLRKVFGPVAWHPDNIERGANEFIRAIRSIKTPKSRSLKLKAEKIYLEILKLIWTNHWKKLK